ncbi:hypothetical protein BpJC7_04400 [Weizmannia acidilactici]|uniref:Uncharacterized protein n=1 Tax=Weizmannia acidilactici TaxID=2607726 RepID=A0A5J4JF46_9BACI|nr:hypothetical protein [Weizmannia acidilactici]GER66226.1 hypothetical protein BpJC4_06970 [Weizmannia acidilactici]GER69137.1 hypothetical protein BpJC7_04400 [Weizmannia acidilactici]
MQEGNVIFVIDFHKISGYPAGETALAADEEVKSFTTYFLTKIS